MNKKRFWLIAFVTALCLSLVAAFGCAEGNNGGTPAKDKESLTITNKLDLTKTWHVEDDDRSVAVELSDGLKSLNYEVTSSNPDSVTVVDGNKIHAVAAGESTVTVAVAKGEKTYSDSFDITVKDKLQFSVTNKDSLETVWSKYDEPQRIIQVNINNIDEYSADDVEVTSSKPDVIKAEGRKLTALKGGDGVEITVSLAGITHKITMSVRVNPVLAVSEEREAVYYVGAQYTLPEVTRAVDSYDTDKSAAVSVEPSQGLTLESGKLSAERHGKYTVKYSFLDEVTGQEIENIVNFEIVNEIFAGSEVGIGTGAHAGNSNTPLSDAGLKITLKGEDEASYKEVVTSSQSALLFGKLKGNDGNPSTYYYAEATFDTVKADITIGLGHFFKTAQTTYRQHGLLSLLNTNSYNFNNAMPVYNKSTDIFISKDSLDNPIPFSYNIFASRHLEKQQNETTIKMAVARDGDYFYTFINDQYVNCVTFENFRKRTTIPAIVGYKLNGNSSATEIYGFEYLWESAEVKAKLDTLLGENKSGMIVPYSGKDDVTKTKTYQKSFEGNKFTTDINDTAGERGLGFDYGTPANFNDSIVSPYIWFDRNFTFQWEYKHTDPAVSFKSSSNTYRMMLEMRDIKYGNEQIQFGALYKRSALGNEFYMNTLGYRGKDGYSRYGEPMKAASAQFDDSLGARFTLTRILKEDHAEITMSATSLADGKTYTRIVRWGGLADENLKHDDIKDNAGNKIGEKVNEAYKTANNNWNRPVILLWHNTCKGEYSNVKWSVLPDEYATVSETHKGTDNFDVTPSAEYTVPDDALTLTRLTQEITEGEEPNVTTQTVDLNEWSFTVDNGATFDIVADFGEGAAAGKYDITLCAKGDNTLGSAAANDILLADLFTVTVELAEGQRYVKLNTKSLGASTGIPLGAGRYQIKVAAHVEEVTPAAEGGLNIANVYVSKAGELFATAVKATV